MVGLIPAHAGKTRPGEGAGPFYGAHPRSRGENDWTLLKALVMPGSSPLTRGKHLSAMFDRSAGGLIPAHAGKTFLLACSVRPFRAHPRSRGENFSIDG